MGISRCCRRDCPFFYFDIIWMLMVNFRIPDILYHILKRLFRLIFSVLLDTRKVVLNRKVAWRVKLWKHHSYLTCLSMFKCPNSYYHAVCEKIDV